ncbi:MAG: ATP-binding cassette domain-containing protein [Armatimonadota bacterium]
MEGQGIITVGKRTGIGGIFRILEHFVLSAESLSAQHPKATAEILQGVDLRVGHGDLLTISGTSGSGKSTLLLALARLTPMASGTLSLDGKPSNQIPPQLWRRRIVMVLQKPTVVPGSVRDNLLLAFSLSIAKKMGQQLPTDDVLLRELQLVGLDHIDLQRNATEISGGEAARLCLVRCLLAVPDVLLCDEPTSSLDPDSEVLVLDRLRQFAKFGGSVIMVRHALDTPVGFRQYHLADGGLKALS